MSTDPPDLAVLRDRTTATRARLDVLHALTPPLSDAQLEAVAAALDDGAFLYPDGGLLGPFDTEEGRERIHVDHTALALLRAHGPGALPVMIRGWHARVRARYHLTEFLIHADPRALADILSTPDVGDAARALLEQPALDREAAEILRWTLAHLHDLTDERLLAHPSAIARTAAVTALAEEPTNLVRLVHYAAAEQHARPACAAVRAVSQAVIAGAALPDPALARLPDLFTSTTAGARLELCALVMHLGPPAIACAAALARLVIRPARDLFDEHLIIAHNAARAIRALGELPPDVRALLESAPTVGDDNLPRRIALALGR